MVRRRLRGTRPRRCISLIWAVAVFGMAACSKESVTSAPRAPTPVLTTVTVSLVPATIRVGETSSASAMGLDQHGSPMSTGAVVWSTGSAAIASVSTSGIVTGLSEGQTPVIATAGGIQGRLTLTVTPAPVASVSVVPSALSLIVGATQQLAAAAKDASGTALAGRAISWASSDPTRASVSATGLVTAVAIGTATITATSEGVSGSAAVTVVPVPVASLAILPTAVSLAIGESRQLTVIARDADGNVLAGRSTTWTSSDPTRVSVTATGLVVGVAAGTATITATSEGKAASTAAFASSPQSPRIPTLIVQPVFFFPTDAPSSSYFAYQASYPAELAQSIRIVQNRFAVLLSGVPFDSTRRNSFFTAPPVVYRSPNSHAYFMLGDAGRPDRFHRMIAELLDWQGATRYTSNAVFVMIYMRPNDNGYFTAGGRTFNGPPGTGGGGCYFDIWEFKTNGRFLSTLIHELGHAFGLLHPEAYGMDQLTNTSIMSYNPANYSIDRFTFGPTQGGDLIPEDYFRLGMNTQVFPNFSYVPAVHNPSGRPVNTTTFLGPMNDPLLRP